MAIVHADSGAGAGTESSGASLDLTCPATVNAGDILIAHVMHTGTGTAPSTPSGWALLHGPANVGTTATARHWAFGKIAVGDEDSDVIGFGTDGGTNGRAGRIYRFTGRVSGTIEQLIQSTSDIPHGTDPQGPTVNTIVAGGLAVALTCQDDNNTEEAIAGASGGTWGGFVTFVDANLGPQGLHIDIQVATPTADPGTISGGAMVAANDEAGTIGFAILPEPVPGPQITVFESDRTTTSPKTVTVTGCVTGDVLYVMAGGDAFGPTNSVTAASAATTAGSTGSWSELAESLSSASEDWCGAYKATVTGNGDVTVQVSRTQSGTQGTWHFWVAKVANGTSGGEEVSTKFTADATEIINAAIAAESAVLFASYDWDAATPGTFTPTGATEVERAADSNYAEASAYWLNQTSGTRDYGTTGSAGTAIKALLVEILTAAGGATGTAAGSYGWSGTASGVVQGAVVGTAGGTYGLNGQATAVRRVFGQAAGSYGLDGTASSFGPFVTAVAGTGTASYFVDQHGQPILIRGYVLWGLLMNAGRWNGGDWELDLENAVAGLEAMGVNVLYTEPLGNTQNGGANNDGSTWDDVFPFTGGDPATFNNTFWQRSDYLFDLCAAAGITVFFNVAYSDDLDNAALSAFTTADFTDYGTSLAARYKTRPNLVWMMGGDYFDTHNTGITAMLTAIRAEGDTHLFGVQNYPETTSRRDIENDAVNDTGTDNSDFNFVYSYNVIYRGIEYGWTEASPIPVLWGDGHFDQDTTADRKVMRDLVWWALTSGARGTIYGSEGTWAWGSGALANLTSDTFPNTDQPTIWDTFAALNGWHLLVPDTDNSLLTAGRGTKGDYVTSSGGGGGEYNSADSQDQYVTGAVTADGTLAVVYFPVDQTVSVDDTELPAAYTVRWVDPADGTSTPESIAGAYSPTGTNSLGGNDWLLVFEEFAGQVGTGAGSYGVAGAATGLGRVVGSATGSYGLDGTATAVRHVAGAVAGSYGWDGAAAGVVIGQSAGTAVGTYGLDGVVVGVRRVVGQLAGSYGLDGTVVVGEQPPPPFVGITVGPLREPLIVTAMVEPLTVAEINPAEPVTAGAIRDTAPAIGTLRDTGPVAGAMAEPVAVEPMREPITVGELT